MCGIAAIMALQRERVAGLAGMLATMNELQAHRGPDGEGRWVHPRGFVGLGHRRLAIIDLATGAQPMGDGAGSFISFNGEVYNYRELRAELGEERFVTRSDTEVLLRSWRRWGERALEKLRGMFAFALWDEAERRLVAARDRFGIKPLYYAEVGGRLLLASEIKALLPFLSEVATDREALKDYLTFQLCLAGKTLFAGVRELQPGEILVASGGGFAVRRYWDVRFAPDFERDEGYFAERIAALLEESVGLHLRSDVPVGAYVSGGVDSSIVAALACRRHGAALSGFTGTFAMGPAYDESRYARALADDLTMPLETVTITASDFVADLPAVVYHLDTPVAGPGSLPQFAVSRLAARHCKVVLGGQGGDEIFGGYARYLIAYFEQCIKAAIDGTMHDGNFVVTYESIIPNLRALAAYKPLLAEFWREGLFEDLDRRYFRLVNRAGDLGAEIDWAALGEYAPFETFAAIFHAGETGKTSYFDSMTRFDFKTLLPALLHVEDRVSMAHSLESRVPFLDHPLVELAATIPSSFKFKDGRMKHALKTAMAHLLPAAIASREDKMGFPVPLWEWFSSPGLVRDFVIDTLSSRRARHRELIDNRAALCRLEREPRFGRALWGLLCLELWQCAFHDQGAALRRRAATGGGVTADAAIGEAEATS